jgi:hypothetical protein
MSSILTLVGTSWQDGKSAVVAPLGVVRASRCLAYTFIVLLLWLEQDRLS